MSRATVLALALAALAGVTPDAASQTVAITNAEIHTVSGAVIPNGTIVLADGVIAAVGANVTVPADAQVIDGTGKIVTPGFVGSASQLGLGEIGGQAPGTQDATTTETDLGAAFNPVWAVNPENTHIPITRLRGMTSTVVVPGGGQLFTGTGALIALAGDDVPGMLRRETVAIYTAMGEQGSGRAGGSRAANYQRLHDALWDVRAQVLGEDEPDEGDDEDQADDDDEEVDEDPRRNGGRSSLNQRNKDALEAVLNGEVPLVVQANRLSDLRLALRLKEEFGIPMVVSGGAEAWRAAAELAAAGVPVMVDPTQNLPTFDGLSATLENAGRLQAAGVEVLLTGGRDLSHRAGLAIANGMDRAAALRAVTLGPATVWGVADRTGSLEEGKLADVVVWSGDPFELSSSAEHVFIGGAEIPQDSRQERLFDRYRDLARYRTIGGR